MPGGSKRGRDAELAHQLAIGNTYEGAARIARVSPSTVFRRLRDEEFRRKVDQERVVLWERSLGLLAQGVVEACVNLRFILMDQATDRKLKANDGELVHPGEDLQRE
jgi:hypothetical protein